MCDQLRHDWLGLFRATLANLYFSRRVPLTQMGVSNQDLVLFYPDKALDGYVLFCQSFDPTRTVPDGQGVVTLMDMRGQPVHEWKVSTPLHLPDLRPDGRLYYDTHTYGPIKGHGMYRLDRDGREIWSYSCRTDHDYHVMDNGHVMIHCLQERVVPSLGVGMRRNPYIIEVDQQGQLVWEWHGEDHIQELTDFCGIRFPVDWDSVMAKELRQQGTWEDAFPELGPSDFALMLNSRGGVLETKTLKQLSPGELATFHKNAVASRTFDWAHNNTCEVMVTNSSSEVDDRFRAGNVLISYRNLDVIAVIDYPSGEIVWAWGPGYLDGQHCPTMMTNGHILIFDNGWRRGWSRVVELDPRKNEIVWEFVDSPRQRFNGTYISGVQPLPNGNVFICDGVHRRLFEVTRGKEIVWEYHGPAQEQSLNKVYRAMRYSADYVAPVIGAA